MMSKTDIERIVDERLAEMRKQMIEELQSQVENEDRLKTIWDLDIRDREEYYRLYGDGRICNLSFDSRIDEDVRNIGNAFLTEKEAEFEAERRKIEAIVRRYARPFKHEEDNYCILYFHDDKRVDIASYLVTDYGIPFLESKEVVEKVIDEIGEDRLKKYWFGIKDDE